MDLKRMNEMLDDKDDDQDGKPSDHDDDDDDESLESESIFQKHKTKIIVAGIILVVVIGAIVLFVTRKKPEPEPEPLPVATPTPDPWLEAQKELYDQGIGSHYIDEAIIFDQGNLESFTFRQDFQQVDQPEMFTLPISITTADDNMSYTKHRAVTAPGVEAYWLEGDFRGRRVVTTIPYSLYQVLAPTGVVGVEIEVVKDATGSMTITYVRALPPTKLGN